MPLFLLVSGWFFLDWWRMWCTSTFESVVLIF